jgi:hypothetical protein
MNKITFTIYHNKINPPMIYIWCCTKSSVALAQFVAVNCSKLKQHETTLVPRACAKIIGFKKLHKQLEKKIIVSGKSLSTLNNYMRCIAHVVLHFNTLPGELDIEQIEEYLLMVKKRNTTASEPFFKHTVYGLRFLLRCAGFRCKFFPKGLCVSAITAF